MGKRRGKKFTSEGLSINHPGRRNKIDKKSIKKVAKISAPSMSNGGSSSLPALEVSNCGASVDISSTSNVFVTSSLASQARKKEKESSQSSSGFIFMCNSKTKPQCYQYRVFGLPALKTEVVKKIKPGTMLFLYDFDVKLLYGVYKATSTGSLDLEPTAFNGKFPAQVRFKIFKECLPLPESMLKVVIKDNYQGGAKFRQELNEKQVTALISAFHPITTTVPITAGPLPNEACPQPFAFTRLEERYRLPARLPHPGVAYLSRVHQNHSLQHLGTQPNQVVARSLYNRYQVEEHSRSVQQPMDNRHIIRQAALPCNSDSCYVAGTPKLYVQDKPFVSLPDPYRSYDVAREMVVRDQIAKYGIESQISQFPKETESGFVPSANYVAEYYGQHFPAAATSHVSTHTHSLPPSYALSQSVQQQKGQHFPAAATSHFSVNTHTLPPSYALSQSVKQQEGQHFPVASTSRVSLNTHTMPPSPTLSQSIQQQEVSQLPKEIESGFVPSANHVAEYYAQHFSADGTSHVSLNAHALPPSCPLPQSENGFVPGANRVAKYYAQHFPAAATSHVSLNAHKLRASYSLPHSAPQQEELSSSYEPYYPLSVHENVRQSYVDHLQGQMAGSSETKLPVTSQFSAAGGYPTYL